MCGIVALFSPRQDDLAPLAAMVAAQRHRGPDDEGYAFVESGRGRSWAYGGPSTAPDLALPALPSRPPDGADLALGHRRLSILDLSPAGHQPMASPDGRLWIAYNGEIYNYLELRTELGALGHRFTTASDTEVLLAAYAQWGPAALQRLNGMWALALYDGRTQTLFCARDRFGVKPLYYHWDGELFACASELKGLLAHPALPRRPSAAAVLSFLARGHLDEGSLTFFEGLSALPAAHQLRLDLRTRELRIERWYSLPGGEERRTEAEELRTLLMDAVRLRLRSDVDVGTCLSGGLDSSSLVALTAQLHDPGQGTGRRAFSIVYTDPELDERAYIRDVVALTGVEAQETTATAADLWRDLPALTRAQDEPIPSPAPYSHWRVMELAHAAGMKVLLDGQGADEALAGYDYHFGPYLGELVRRQGLGAAWREARAARRVTSRPLWFFLGLMAYHALPWPTFLRHAAVARMSTHRPLPEALLDPDLLRSVGALPGRRHAPRPDLRAERLDNLVATSLPALLRYEDRNSMAFGIETRTPFLDYRLVELALALPIERLIHDGWTKAILREAMRGLLPESVRLRRKKLGFPTPESRWLRELAPQARELLAPGALAESYLRPGVLRTWLSGTDAHLAGRRGLWRLIALEHWLRYAAGVR